MKKLLLILIVAGATAQAKEPDRESLIAAWESYLSSLPSTEAFEKTGEDRYVIEDTELKYSGSLELVSALVRPSESYGQELEYSHFGVVEFRLPDLPTERMGSQAYYYWVADRQMLYYDHAEETWVDAATYRASFMEDSGVGISLGPLQFMLNYGIWILLVGLLIFVFVVLNKHNRKAKTLMDDSADINEQARRNIERAAELQTEMLEMTRASQELQKQSNALLERIASSLENKN